MTKPILEIDKLSIAIPQPEGDNTLVHDCTVSVGAGEAVGLVGESGSGKTLSVRAVAGLLPDHFRTGGIIRYEGQDLAELSAAERRSLRAREIGMVFQSPRAHLNPLRTIGDFLTEAMITVTRTRPADAERKAIELLDEVGISDPARRLNQRPAELSGGILQRVMIASTLAMDPKLLLADEITTALDVTTQEEVMAVIGELRKHRNLSLLFITHDLTLAGAVCDRVAVMQHGRIVETLNAATMRADATQEYTKTLMAAALRDDTRETAEAGADASDESQALLQVSGLRKTYQVLGATGRRETFTAVEDVGFELEAGGSLGIVGESGSGKSTTAKLICGLERADAGTIRMDGQNWDRPPRGGRARRARAHYVQMVFQDPYQSLDPRQTVRQCLTEAIHVHQPRATAAQINERISELMTAVMLDEVLLDRRPKPLSGGQRQRVAIARALAADPRVLVLDEAVSALDVTTQVEILSLLDRIRRETGVALLMITHDLTVIRRLCNDVIVMRDGRVEEYGTSEQILDEPKAEYTRQLLESIPRDGWQPKRRNLDRTSALPTL